MTDTVTSPDGKFRRNPTGPRQGSPRAETFSMELFSNHRDEAIERGHDMELGWHDAAPAAWIAQCRDCEGFLGLDYADAADGSAGTLGQMTPYGRVVENMGECPKAPPQAKPVIRNPYEEEAAQFLPKQLTNRAINAASPVYIESWNWDAPKEWSWRRKTISENEDSQEAWERPV